MFLNSGQRSEPEEKFELVDDKSPIIYWFYETKS